MSDYTDKVVLTPSGKDWRLISEVRWEIGRKGSGYWFVVPAGRVSDLASIPWYLRWLFDRGDARLAKASIVHDEMLRNPTFSRITAAAEFAMMLLADKVDKWAVGAMGLGVLYHTTRKETSHARN